MASLKLVVVARTDLGMSAGKLAAQVAHAVVGCVQVTSNKRTASGSTVMNAWSACGQPIVVLQAVDEEHLRLVQVAAQSLVHWPVIDAGRTQVDPGTWTCLGIGPAPASVIDSITGKGGCVPLKLYP